MLAGLENSLVQVRRQTAATAFKSRDFHDLRPLVDKGEPMTQRRAGSDFAGIDCGLRELQVGLSDGPQ